MDTVIRHEVVLRTQAVSIVNKGGGRPTRTIREKIGNDLAVKKSALVHQEAIKREPGSDYVIWLCPRCKQRNRQSCYQAVDVSAETPVFRCSKCRGVCEVTPPPKKAPDLILGSNEQVSRSRGIVVPGLVGPDGKPIGRNP